MSRDQSEFSLTDKDGFTRIYTVVPFVTPDDLMLISMQAIAAEIKFGIEYESPSTREVRNHLILSRVTHRS